VAAVRYISETKDIVKESCALFQNDGAAAFELSEKSAVPPTLTAMDLQGSRTPILNVRQNRQINRYPAESDEHSSPESISDTQNWLNWYGDLRNSNVSEDDWETDIESDIELDNGSEDFETPEQRNINDITNVPGMIRPIRQTKKIIE
jgi:hypothetical protein